MVKTKKQMFIVISIFTLILLLGGATYAWFYYRGESGESEAIAGDIYLTMTEGNETLTLTNIFPETKEEARARNDNYITFTLNRLNESNKAIYYEILLSHGDDKPSPKSRYNDADLVFDLVELDSNGNEVTYVVDAISYDSLNNTRIWVDNIASNTQTNVAKKYKLRAWLSDEVIISDSETNANYNTTEFPNKYATISVKVNGDMTYKEMPSAYAMLRDNADTTTQINFAEISSDSNGKGLYKLKGTENDTNPIYYYRGEINNNNVIFAGFCWQMVRTTDTGGIKMIYNGEPTINSSGNNVAYDCGTTRPFQNSIRTTTNLQTSTGYFYADDYEIVSTEGNGATYRLKSKTNPITRVVIADDSDASTNIPTIVANYPYTCKKTTDTGTCAIIYKVDSYSSGTDAYVYASTDIGIIGKSAFNSNYKSVSDLGYMSNIRYEYRTSGWEENALFASGATWVTDHYELTDASVTVPDASHHYSCNATSADAICTSLRYVYYLSGRSKYYITLTNGELIEDALYKMTGNGNTQTKQNNSSYVLNQNNSTVKSVIDTWFETNLTNVVDNTKTDYRTYLEDTIWCNDRSFKTVSGSYATYQEGGWNPNPLGTSGNGNLAKYLYFGSMNRAFNNWYSTTNVPSTACPNESDRFTVSGSNGNGALTYPVGLLTADEIVMAGASGSSYTANQTHYLYTGNYYWSMSPSNFVNANAFEYDIYSDGRLDNDYVASSFGVRPVVSLKSGVEFEEDGDGTPTNPYVVKY